MRLLPVKRSKQPRNASFTPEQLRQFALDSYRGYIEYHIYGGPPAYWLIMSVDENLWESAQHPGTCFRSLHEFVEAYVHLIELAEANYRGSKKLLPPRPYGL